MMFEVQLASQSGFSQHVLFYQFTPAEVGFVFFDELWSRRRDFILALNGKIVLYLSINTYLCYALMNEPIHSFKVAPAETDRLIACISSFKSMWALHLGSKSKPKPK